MWPLVFVAALFWLGGSVGIGALMPWRTFEREDVWLMIAVTVGWPIVLTWASIELLYEQLKPAKTPWWMRGRP